MAIPLTGAGSLFVKLGHDAAGFFDILALAGGTATARVLSGASFVTRTATLEADYANGTPQYQIIDGFATAFANVTGTGGCQNLLAQISPTLQTLAVNTIISMANTDTPLPNPNLLSAMTLLIQQMRAAATGVTASTVTAGSPTAFVATTTGNPVIVMSVKNAIGLTCEYTIPETITFTCTNDSVTGGATAKQEIFSALGQNALPSELLYNWGNGTYGSGCAIAGYSLVNAALNNSGGNLLQNSEFVTATTTNVPDNWTIVLGTAGTNVFQANTGYVDSASLKFVGDGTTFMQVTQAFNTTPSPTVGGGGTSAILAADTQYAVNMFVNAQSPTSGTTLIVDLIDTTENTAILDDQGTANSFTTTLSTLFAGALTITGATNATPIVITSTAHGLVTGQEVTTASVGGNTSANGTFNIVVLTANTFALVGSAGNGSYTSGGTATLTWSAINGVFRTPATLPATTLGQQKLRIRLGGTVSANGKITYIDRVAMTPMTTLYQGGPAFAMFSANANPVSSGFQPDQFTVGITNTFGQWQQFFEQFFGMRALGLQLPSNQTTTISAGLIT